MPVCKKWFAFFANKLGGTAEVMAFVPIIIRFCGILWDKGFFLFRTGICWLIILRGVKNGKKNTLQNLFIGGPNSEVLAEYQSRYEKQAGTYA